MTEPPETDRDHARGDVAVVLATAEGGSPLASSLASIKGDSLATVLCVPASAAAVNEAVQWLAPADVVVLQEACLVPGGWLERLHDAALVETNIATVSALADVGTELSLGEESAPRRGVEELAEGLAVDTLRLRPRLNRAVGPCVYLRRDALELVGALDEELSLRSALDVDFSQRCLLAGLSHILADDVVVARPVPSAATETAGDPHHDPDPGGLAQRYPYLAATPLAQSSVLELALRAARGRPAKLSLTLDARALDGGATGTQVHILELILELARSGSLRLRLLLWRARIDTATLALLEDLAATELLFVEDVDADTARSIVFYRPQQAFSHSDVALALALGERVVISQLDLIAYRNPGYFSDAASWQEYRRASRAGLGAAERVVVFSEHTRRELISDALVPAERIEVVAPGLDHRGARPGRRPRGLPADHADERFLLCLGTDFRHKNRVFALRVLQSLLEINSGPMGLVLAGTHVSHGSSGEVEEEFLREHSALRKHVVDLGSVSEEEKAWLVTHARAVLYPSVYEGFGLVPFECALAGVPCLFAPQASLAEVAPEGTAGIVPWEPARSAGALQLLLHDQDFRSRHIRALADVARALTWAATAATMLEVFHAAAEAPVREAATLSRDIAERERALHVSHQRSVDTLIEERELVLGDYRKLMEEVGPGRSLVGPRGSLPEDVQRLLLAVSSRRALARPLFAVMGSAFALLRRGGRTIRRAHARRT